MEQWNPGVKVQPEGDSLSVIIPDEVKTGHEQRFSNVIKKYLHYLKEEKMPDWEISFTLTKYFTTTQALKIADSQ